MPGQTSPPPSDVVLRSVGVMPVGAAAPRAISAVAVRTGTSVDSWSLLVHGAGNGAVLAELKACTPASLSPSKRVTGLFGLRQKSSAAGSANHIPTCPTNPFGSIEGPAVYSSPYSNDPGSEFTSRWGGWGSNPRPRDYEISPRASWTCTIGSDPETDLRF